MIGLVVIQKRQNELIRKYSWQSERAHEARREQTDKGLMGESRTRSELGFFSILGQL